MPSLGIILVEFVDLGVTDAPRASSSDLSLCMVCLLYTSDAADDLLCVDLCGRRIIKKKKKTNNNNTLYTRTHHVH